VHLHPCAIQLCLERCCAAEFFERLGDACRGLRQHRADRSAHSQGERVQCHCAAGKARGGDRGQVSAQHRRAPHGGGGDLRGGGDRIGHHARQRALTQLTGEQPSQKRLLDLGCGREQSGNKLGASRL
jgi:hypothetical protein